MIHTAYAVSLDYVDFIFRHIARQLMAVGVRRVRATICWMSIFSSYPVN